MKRILLLALVATVLLGSAASSSYADSRIRVIQVQPMEGDPTEPSRAFSDRIHTVAADRDHPTQEYAAVARNTWLERFLRNLLWRAFWTVR